MCKIHCKSFCCSNLRWYKMYFIRYKVCLSLLTSSLWLSQDVMVDAEFLYSTTVEEMLCIVCKVSVLTNCNRFCTDDEPYWCVVNSRPSVTVFYYHWKLPFFSCVWYVWLFTSSNYVIWLLRCCISMCVNTRFPRVLYRPACKIHQDFRSKFRVKNILFTFEAWILNKVSVHYEVLLVIESHKIFISTISLYHYVLKFTVFKHVIFNTIKGITGDSFLKVCIVFAFHSPSCSKICNNKFSQQNQWFRMRMPLSRL